MATVVEYDDNEDREERFRWNVAKHDCKCNTVRWSSVYQKILVAANLYQKLGNWDGVRAECKSTYGINKADSYNRWIRAAKGLSALALEELKKYPRIRSKMIFDNNYMIFSHANARIKLSDEGAVQALDVFGSEEGREMNVDTFIHVVCKGMRLLEVWRELMIKRFGSLANNSAAFKRLCAHLQSMAGLESILTCKRSTAGNTRMLSNGAGAGEVQGRKLASA